MASSDEPTLDQLFPKLGGREDIRHQTPHDLEGEDYGQVVCYLMRRRKIE